MQLQVSEMLCAGQFPPFLQDVAAVPQQKGKRHPSSFSVCTTPHHLPALPRQLSPGTAARDYDDDGSIRASLLLQWGKDNVNGTGRRESRFAVLPHEEEACCSFESLDTVRRTSCGCGAGGEVDTGGTRLQQLALQSCGSALLGGGIRRSCPEEGGCSKRRR